MKTASTNNEHHALGGAMGSARLELLCRTAIMQGTDEKRGATMPTKCVVAPSTATIHHGFHEKSSDLAKSKTVIPALSSEPSVITTITATTASQAIKAAVPGTTKSWAPSSFVDIKCSKVLSLVPSSATSTQNIQQRIMFPPPLDLSSKIKQESSCLRDSLQQPQLALSATSAKSSSIATAPAIKQEQVATQQPVNRSSHPMSFKQLIGENVRLKIELGEAKKEIARLKKEMNKANYNINELRSMSGNKISEIPLADMIQIMQEYGSEVSGQSFQRRKDDPQPASIVRQFRRWNPDFLKYFFKKNGKWVPKLGKAGELQRRRQKREALRAHRRNPPGGLAPPQAAQASP